MTTKNNATPNEVYVVTIMIRKGNNVTLDAETFTTRESAKDYLDYFTDSFCKRNNPLAVVRGIAQHTVIAQNCEPVYAGLMVKRKVHESHTNNLPC